ncbi:MAG: phosphomannose isomerase type II C-terminal cupin domain [Candidatus Omnitrophota bacterium]
MVKKICLEKKYIEIRPWGKFEQFTHGEPTTVKILTVNPREALSLQYHRRRQEFWKVISGKARITVGDTTRQARKGDEFFIAQRQKHQIQTSKSTIKVLEISFGCFDEDDIVRLKDKYKRG